MTSRRLFLPLLALALMAQQSIVELLPDPGKNLSPLLAAAARLEAWRRPTNPAIRQALRNGRIAMFNALNPKARISPAQTSETILIFASEAHFNAFRDDVVVTPNIEGGIGPVLISQPSVAADGRRAIRHIPWREVDLAWIQAYTHGDSPAIQFAASLPANWYPAEIA
jgi:hypothetical protein